MCGNTARASGGGTIAVLKAVDNVPDISLIFNANDAASTLAIFEALDNNSPDNELERCRIIIQ